MAAATEAIEEAMEEAMVGAETAGDWAAVVQEGAMEVAAMVAVNDEAAMVAVMATGLA